MSLKARAFPAVLVDRGPAEQQLAVAGVVGVESYALVIDSAEIPVPTASGGVCQVVEKQGRIIRARDYAAS